LGLSAPLPEQVIEDITKMNAMNSNNQNNNINGQVLNYDLEHDACGIGLIVNIDGSKDYRVLDDA